MAPRRIRRSTLLTATNPRNSFVSFRVSRITSSGMQSHTVAAGYRRVNARSRRQPVFRGDLDRLGHRAIDGTLLVNAESYRLFLRWQIREAIGPAEPLDADDQIWSAAAMPPLSLASWTERRHG